MIARSTRNAVASQAVPSRKKSSGFTLLELMVAMSIFLVIGGAAISLFKQNASLFTDQQTQVGVNISLRNSLALMQTDAVNAGDGYFTSTSTNSWPIGVTIANGAGPIDTLNIITAATAPAQLPLASCVNTNTGTTVTLVPPPLPATLTAGQFSTGDEVLFLNGAGNQMTVATLTAPGAAVGANVQLTFNPTLATGANNAANDVLGLTTNFDTSDPNYQLGVQYCQNSGDWVAKLSSITYTVDPVANQLTRKVGAAAADVIADQIIGFKVGAATYQSAGNTSTTAYAYNAAAAPPAGYLSKFNSIRSVRVSIIGRTPPTRFLNNNFKNSFDGGNYRIESLSTVINPRNLSMND